jgi:hypothetical protein
LPDFDQVQVASNARRWLVDRERRTQIGALDAVPLDPDGHFVPPFKSGEKWATT